MAVVAQDFDPTEDTPADRAGITLDLINKPQLNLVKVILALVVNVVADLIFIHFAKNIYGAALASIITMTASTVYGYVVLRRYLPVSFRGMAGLVVPEVKGQLTAAAQKLRLVKA